MSMARVVVPCFCVVVLATAPILAQAPNTAVVVKTSAGSVRAVASGSLTYSGPHVLEAKNALSRATIDMSGDTVPTVRDVLAFTISDDSPIRGKTSPAVLLVLRYSDETALVGFNLPAVVSHVGSVTEITPAPLSAARLTATIADVTQRANRREAPTAIYLGVGVHVQNVSPQHVLHLVRLDTEAER